jgi:hypothetical protein
MSRVIWFKSLPIRTDQTQQPSISFTVLDLPNDKPQGRGASPRPAGGTCSALFPLQDNYQLIF